MLTQYQKDLYVNNCGEWCPYCEEKDLQNITYELLAGVILFRKRCQKCGEVWDECYRLVGIDEVPRQPDQSM